MKPMIDRNPITTYAQALERIEFLQGILVDDHGICEDCAALLADLRVFLESSMAGRGREHRGQASAMNIVVKRYPDAIYTANPCNRYKPGVWTCTPTIRWLGEDWDDAVIRQGLRHRSSALPEPRK